MTANGIVLETALILGNYRPSFVLAKSLSNRGYKVVCGLRGYDRGGEVSRYVDAIWDDTRFEDKPDELQSALTDLIANNPDIKLVFPATESYVRAFAESRLTLPKGVKLGSMPAEVINRCFDKCKLLSLADGLGVPIAAFAVTSSAVELEQEASRVGFPLVVRPLDSTVTLDGKKAATCNTLEDLLASYRHWQRDNPSLLIQRHVSGKRDNIYFAAHEGDVHRYLHARIERTDRADGSGLALEGVTVPPCPKLKSFTEKLIKKLNYSGIGCAQYLVDAETGEQNFLEINPRLAGNHALPEACGLDLGGWLTELALKMPHDLAFRTGSEGVRYTWLAGELAGIRRSVNEETTGKWEALKAGLVAIMAAVRSDLDMGFPSGNLKPGLITLCDSLPLIGRGTRLRFDRDFAGCLLINKVQYR